MPWLSALAHAQRRMGFKHGTALLVSDDLVSPVSWGVMRPVILLDSRALAATHEAEAIIAHELAHIARLDWAKLLAARIVTGVFWFNPLAWKLAAECHQLREEAADDAVLHSQVDGPDYASLLVGAARHENKALLLAAHGVAPGKTSLSRRVARVLDRGLSRAPARRTWTLICSVAAVTLSAPLAALTPVVPGLAMAEAGPESLVASVVAAAARPASPPRQPAPPLIPAPARSAPPRAPASVAAGPFPGPAVAAGTSSGSMVVSVHSTLAPLRPVPSVPQAPPMPPMPPMPPQPSLAIAAARLSAVAQATPLAVAQVRPNLDAIISRNIHGVTPAYARELRRAGLTGLSAAELVKMKIYGVDAADFDGARGHAPERDRDSDPGG